MIRAISRERIARHFTGLGALRVHRYYFVGPLVLAHQVWIDASQVPTVSGFSLYWDKVGHLFWWAIEQRRIVENVVLMSI
jgi:hypothetical protein